ncbi:alpha/beta fold hydrolase [Amycolatopsis sp. CA-161197]|uniref:alpha/beta fold hydrolase n=1 Tax=unclassified Amycolatopsis TaxID=2618356 RepID=UPI00345437C5
MDIVLVHGAWCGGWIWDDVAHRLRSAGHEVHVVEQLPSSDPAAFGDLAADAKHLRAVIDRCAGEAFVVGHSYGGMVLTEVADHPKIRHSAYLTAFWPVAGQSLMDIRSEHHLEWLTGGPDGTLHITDDQEIARQVLGSDVDSDRFAIFHRNRQAQSVASFTSVSTAPPRNHPTTYVVCERDQGIQLADQERMASRADVVHRLDAAHLAPFSQPEALTKLLLGLRS